MEDLDLPQYGIKSLPLAIPGGVAFARGSTGYKTAKTRLDSYVKERGLEYGKLVDQDEVADPEPVIDEPSSACFLIPPYLLGQALCVWHFCQKFRCVRYFF